MEKKAKEGKTAKVENIMVIEPRVIVLMEKMGYTHGIGLGKFGQWITEMIKVHTQKATCKYGLGYKEDMKVTLKNKKTLNGNFIKAGESFPYYGFPKLWVRNEEKLSGLEIFFNSKLTLKDTLEEEDTKVGKIEAEDWVDYLGPKAMRLFDGDVLMLEDDEAAVEL